MESQPQNPEFRINPEHFTFTHANTVIPVREMCLANENCLISLDENL